MQYVVKERQPTVDTAPLQKERDSFPQRIMPSLIPDGRSEFCFLQQLFFPGFLYSVMFLYIIPLGQWGKRGERDEAERDTKSRVLQLSLNQFLWLYFCATLFLISLSFSFIPFCSWHLHFLEEWKKYISLILNSIYLHKLVRVYDLKDSAVFKIGLFLSLKIISTQYRRVRRRLILQTSVRAPHLQGIISDVVFLNKEIKFICIT